MKIINLLTRTELPKMFVQKFREGDSQLVELISDDFIFAAKIQPFNTN